MANQAGTNAEQSPIHAISSFTRSLSLTTAVRDHSASAATKRGGNADLFDSTRYYHPSMRESVSGLLDNLD